MVLGEVVAGDDAEAVVEAAGHDEDAAGMCGGKTPFEAGGLGIVFPMIGTGKSSTSNMYPCTQSA